MMKFRYTALPFIAILLFSACDSSDSSDSRGDDSHELSQKNVYEGYAETSNGDPLFLTVYAPNNDALLMEKLDKNNDQTIIKGSLIDHSTMAFDGLTCAQSTDELTCNGFKLPIKDLFEIYLDDLSGTYNAVDGANVKRELVLNNDGTFVIINTENIDCMISGNVSLELNGALAAIALNADNCNSNGDFSGVAAVENLYHENDTLNIMIDGFVDITDYWVKR